jgi:hypothetical protein
MSEQRDQIRLRKLKAQLWFCAVFFAIYLGATGLMFSKGHGLPPVLSLAVLAIFIWLFIRISLKICGCKKDIDKP